MFMPFPNPKEVSLARAQQAAPRQEASEDTAHNQQPPFRSVPTRIGIRSLAYALRSQPGGLADPHRDPQRADKGQRRRRLLAHVRLVCRPDRPGPIGPSTRKPKGGGTRPEETCHEHCNR